MESKEYPHQIEELRLAQIMPNRGLLWEMGTGKTKGMIDILRDKFKDRGMLLKTIIFSPSVTLYNWGNEFEKWSKIPSNQVHPITATGAKRIKDLERAVASGGVIIINYEAVQNKRIYELLFQYKPVIVVADESHLLKNYKSSRAKNVVKIGDLANYRFILTGTPILNALTDIFHQFRFLDKGVTFGKNFYVFQDKYMMDANKAWANRPGYFPRWVPRKETLDELNEKIYRICSRVTKEEALPNLPPLVTITKHVKLGVDQQKAYNQMKTEFITFVKSKSGESKAVVAQLALTKALRLQQITSGHVVTDEGEVITFKSNPRLAEAQDLLVRLTPEHKVIVWCCFKEDYKAIGKICRDNSIEHVFLTGEMNLKGKQDAMDKFNNDSTCRTIIANRKAGGIGINLVASSYSVVYSRNFSLGDELQSEARNHRGGSEIHEQITKINLCAKDTIDEVVLDALSGKQKLSDRIIDWVHE